MIIISILLNIFTPEKKVPIITIGPEDKTVFIGSEITLTCTATGDPIPQIYILKSGVPQAIEVTFGNDGEWSSEFTTAIIGNCIACNAGFDVFCLDQSFSDIQSTW